MKKAIQIFIIGFICSLALVSCNKKGNGKKANNNTDINIDIPVEQILIPFDSIKINAFFTKHPKFKEYESEIKELYKKRSYNYIWFDKKGIIEFANVIYNQVSQISEEGVLAKLPYKEQIDTIFYEKQTVVADVNSELMVSAMYFFYVKNVYQGLNTEISKESGWHLPREKVSYVAYLDTLIKDPKLLKKDISEKIPLYYDLKKGLLRYQEIQKKGGWGTITMKEGVRSLKPGDSTITISEVRKRLFITGDLDKNSGSNVFDDDLLKAIATYQKRMNQTPRKLINQELLQYLNIPVEERIKTIVVNMERCRWISPDLIKGGEYIAVNIPSYRMRYVKNNALRLESNVVVGKDLNQTIVFSGQMSYLVFSPYWNVPTSIINKEVKPGMAKDKDYLEKHDMEWNNGGVRQKPGPKNSLGLVKFMFPNSNNIYLHDTPSKGLFNRDNRAFSHGCVRVEKVKALANAILENDKNWNAAKISKAMNSGKETAYSLKKKIPVYIAYFTALADEKGNMRFFEDVYKRDARLAGLLYK